VGLIAGYVIVMGSVADYINYTSILDGLRGIYPVLVSLIIYHQKRQQCNYLVQA